MFTQYFLFIYLFYLLFIRQYNHLENYVAKELIRKAKAKYQIKSSKVSIAKERDV